MPLKAILGLRPYTAILGARFRVRLQYRVAALAGAGTQFFWGFIRIMILSAFYASAVEEPPMGFAAVVSYVWLSQALLGLLPWSYDQEIGEMIRRGDVVYELTRPLDLYSLWYMRTLAMRTAAASLRSLPILVFAGLLLPLAGFGDWSLAPPASGLAAVCFGLALTAAVALGCALTMLVHVSLLWTLGGDGLARLMPMLVSVLSGMVIPLPLFPDGLQPVIGALPFRGLVDVPLRIYSGHIPLEQAWGEIGLVILWAVLLIAVGRGLLARGLRVLVAQGG